jgi:type 1 glutamine amidotransferase
MFPCFFTRILFPVIIIASSFKTDAQSTKNVLKNKTVLVYTKNGKGYVHENISSSIAAIQKLGSDLKFKVDTSTNAAIFTDEELKKFDVVIFSNTNNDVFDTEQQKIAFMRYIQAGGSFMGIHSAAGTERNWKWFKLLLGASFLRHPPFQGFTVYVLNPKHPAVKGLSPSWTTNDECYYFKEFNADIDVLLFTDISTLKEDEGGKNVKPDVFGNRYPAAWCHEFDGGRAWYTALGHSREDYSNPTYLAHIIEGLKWLTNKSKLNYNKATATSSTTFNEMKVF